MIALPTDRCLRAGHRPRGAATVDRGPFTEIRLARAEDLTGLDVIRARAAQAAAAQTATRAWRAAA